MKTLLFYFLLLLALVLSLNVASANEDVPHAGKTTHSEDDDRITVARARFTDPSKPGTLTINVPYGKLKIKGTSSKEIVIVSTLPPRGKPHVDTEGFRRLDANSTFDLVEKEDNAVEITLNNMRHLLAHSRRDPNPEFKIYLPAETNLVITESTRERFAASALANIEVEDIKGDLEIKPFPHAGPGEGKKGNIALENITGAIIIETRSSKTTVELSASPAKPINISSSPDGSIDLELPADAKATLLLWTDSGIARTSFPEKTLRATTEALVDINRLPKPAKISEVNPVSSPEYSPKAFLLNGGGASIQLSTHTGTLTVKKRNND